MNACVRCHTTKRAALPDEYGIHWCGRCYAQTVIEAEQGFQMLQRYLVVKARQASTLDRIREYTEGTQ